MQEKQDRAARVIALPANDNGLGQAAVEEAKRHLSTIARALGRHIAREQMRAGAQERRQQAEEFAAA